MFLKLFFLTISFAKSKKPVSYTHLLHQAGLQHGQANVVDTGISGNDAAGIGHYFLGDVEHRHHTEGGSSVAAGIPENKKQRHSNESRCARCV